MLYYIGIVRVLGGEYVYYRIFRSVRKPTRALYGDVYKYVVGPFVDEESAERFARGKGYIKESELSNPSRAKYCRKRIMSPKLLEAGSFRVVSLSRRKGVKGIVGCPKGKMKRKRCGVGMKLQSILYPVGHKKCPRPGLELNPGRVSKEKKVRQIIARWILDRRSNLGATESMVVYLMGLPSRELDTIYRREMGKGRGRKSYKKNVHLKGNKEAQIEYIVSKWAEAGSLGERDVKSIVLGLRGMSDRTVYRLYRALEKKYRKRASV